MDHPLKLPILFPPGTKTFAKYCTLQTDTLKKYIYITWHKGIRTKSLFSIANNSTDRSGLFVIRVGKRIKGGQRFARIRVVPYRVVQLIVLSLRRGTAWSRRLANSFRGYTTRCKLCNASRSAHAKLYRWSQSSPLTRMCDRAQSKINTVPQEYERSNIPSWTTEGSVDSPPLVPAFLTIFLLNRVKEIFNWAAIHAHPSTHAHTPPTRRDGPITVAEFILYGNVPPALSLNTKSSEPVKHICHFQCNIKLSLSFILHNV